MKPITRIVCGVDLDDASVAPAAIHWSHRLAALAGAEFHLVGVTDPQSAERSPELLASIHEEALAELEKESPDVGRAAQYHTTMGPLADALVAYATSIGADLVVAPSHPHEGVTSLGVGGIGHVLAHRLDTPVATVSQLAGPLDHGTFVVGVDGATVGAKALAWTRQLASATHGKCCAVYSIDDLYGTFDSEGQYGRDEAIVRHTVVPDALTELVERMGGDPAETLQDVATERNAAAIVVAARQRHSLGGMLLGLVPDHLLHHPQGPVIVLPHSYLATASLAPA